MSEVEQGTPAWFDARAGNITSSRIKDVMTKPRKGQKYSAVRKEYMAQLVCERLTKKSLEEERGNYFDIKRGKEMESVARSVYELRKGVAVHTVGFVKHPTMPFAGCSPDGYIGNKGLAQFKAPRRHIHLDWIMNGVVPSEHKDQMLFELACHPDREWDDFVSYIDDLDDLPHLQLFDVRLYPDAARIQEIETEVAKFNAEIEEVIAKLPTTEGETALQHQLEKSLEMIGARQQV